METRKISLVTVFGVLYFAYRQVTLLLLPPPLPDLLILPVTIILGISYLVVGFGGATYSALIAGLLISVTDSPLFPFTVLIAVIFGLTIDIFSDILRIREKVNASRLIVSLSISSSITGLVAFYSTIAANIVPYQFMIDAVIIADGVVSGAVSGVLVNTIWKRYLRDRIPIYSTPPEK